MSQTPVTFSCFLAAVAREKAADQEKYDAEAARPMEDRLHSGDVAGPLLCSNAAEYPPQFVPIPEEPFGWGKVDSTREVHCLAADDIISHQESSGGLPKATLAYNEDIEAYTWDFAEAPELATCVFPQPYTDYDSGIREKLKTLVNELGGESAWPSGPECRVASGAAKCARDRAFEACLDDNLPLVAIKGPPGTGKTDLLAEVALALATRGKKVGIVTVAHAAVEVALRRIAEQRGDADKPTLAKASKTYSIIPGVENGKLGDLRPKPDIWATVIASAIYFISPSLKFRYGTCDVLLLDEAGQIPAYTAAALSPMAPRMIFFGDEAQLPAIFQGDHPPGSHGDSSAMAYLRDVLPEASLALDISHRMNATICGLIQRHFYPDIPTLKAGKNAQASLLEGGKPFPALVRDDFPHAVPRLSRSSEEAARVAQWVKRLLAMDVTLSEGGQEGLITRGLQASDIAILTPFRAQVRAIEDALESENLPAGIRVGSVDKMQGQGAAVVIYSLASSSEDYIAGQAEWLLSPNRWNVALSRAIACAVVVGDMDAHLKVVPNALGGLAAQARIATLVKDKHWQRQKSST